MTGGGGVVREENTNEESTLYSLTIVSLHSSLHPTHTIHHTLHHVLCFFRLGYFVLPLFSPLQITQAKGTKRSGGKRPKRTKWNTEVSETHALFVSFVFFWSLFHIVSKVCCWSFSLCSSCSFHYKWLKGAREWNETRKQRGKNDQRKEPNSLFFFFSFRSFHASTSLRSIPL